ncbi:MAG: Zn(2+)-responsive transcriptional regulator [Gammaproteobacteria bacterium]|nr:MAG: Zn(2+)-responsive transcriptional regulator [Gammaproteobacteria bacterium]
MSALRIGDITRKLGISADTLRYYEKIGLFPRVNRTVSGIRLYSDRDISRLQFIKRAQKMNFTLAEIGQLLKMREGPQMARTDVRDLTSKKLDEIEAYLADLKALRKELRLLLNLCASSKDGCPILENIDETSPPRKRRRSGEARPKAS